MSPNIYSLHFGPNLPIQVYFEAEVYMYMCVCIYVYRVFGHMEPKGTVDDNGLLGRSMKLFVRGGLSSPARQGLLSRR